MLETDCGFVRRWNSPSVSLPLGEAVRTRSSSVEDRSVFLLFRVLKTVYFSLRFVFFVCLRRVWRVFTLNILPFPVILKFILLKDKLWASVYRNNTYSPTYPKLHLEPFIIEKQRLIKWPQASRSSAYVGSICIGYKDIFINFLVGVVWLEKRYTDNSYIGSDHHPSEAHGRTKTCAFLL